MNYIFINYINNYSVSKLALLTIKLKINQQILLLLLSPILLLLLK